MKLSSLVKLWKNIMIQYLRSLKSIRCHVVVVVVFPEIYRFRGPNCAIFGYGSLSMRVVF